MATFVEQARRRAWPKAQMLEEEEEEEEKKTKKGRKGRR